MWTKHCKKYHSGRRCCFECQKELKKEERISTHLKQFHVSQLLQEPGNASDLDEERDDSFDETLSDHEDTSYPTNVIIDEEETDHTRKYFRQMMVMKDELNFNDKQFVSLCSFMSQLTNILPNDQLQNLFKMCSSVYFMKKNASLLFGASKMVDFRLNSKVFHRISVLSYVKQKLCVPFILETIKNAQHYVPVPGIYTSWRDGSAAAALLSKVSSNMEKKSQSRQIRKGNLVNETLLQIYIDIFLDDFNVNNPLGSTSKTGKLLGIYMILSDIPLKYQSRREDVMILSVIPREDVDQSSMRNSMECIRYELKRLERKSRCVVIGNEEIRFRVILNALVGDNLGINEIAGLSKSFHKGFACVHCLIRYNGVQIPGFEVEMRSQDVWNKDVRNICVGIKSNGMMRVPAFYGLKIPDMSALYPPDYLHTCVLGAYKDYLEVMFEMLHDRNIIHISVIIEVICDTYSRVDPMISKCGKRNKFKLSGTGHGIHGLFVRFPEIILLCITNIRRSKNAQLKTKGLKKLNASLKTKGMKKQQKTMNMDFQTTIGCFTRQEALNAEKLESEQREEDATLLDSILSESFFDGYLQLRAIDAILLKRSVTIAEIQMLRACINLFLNSLNTLIKKSILPKYHILSHFPESIMKFGPVNLHDTIRYERRHQTIKRWMRTSFNKINKNKSIMSRVSRVNMLPRVNRVINDGTFNTLSIHGINFKVGQVYFTNSRLLQVSELSVVSGNKMVTCNRLKVCGFNRYLFAYEVKETEDQCRLNIDQLLTEKSSNLFSHGSVCFCNKVVNSTKY